VLCAVCPQTSKTALHEAALTCHADVVSEMLRKEADHDVALPVSISHLLAWSHTNLHKHSSNSQAFVIACMSCGTLLVADQVWSNYGRVVERSQAMQTTTFLACCHKHRRQRHLQQSVSNSCTSMC
jgi:hypothetical protein